MEDLIAQRIRDWHISERSSSGSQPLTEKAQNNASGRDEQSILCCECKNDFADVLCEDCQAYVCYRCDALSPPGGICRDEAKRYLAASTEVSGVCGSPTTSLGNKENMDQGTIRGMLSARKGKSNNRPRLVPAHKMFTIRSEERNPGEMKEMPPLELAHDSLEQRQNASNLAKGKKGTCNQLAPGVTEGRTDARNHCESPSHAPVNDQVHPADCTPSTEGCPRNITEVGNGLPLTNQLTTGIHHAQINHLPAKNSDVVMPSGPQSFAQSFKTKSPAASITFEFRKKVLKIVEVNNKLWLLLSNDLIHVVDFYGKLEKTVDATFRCGMDMCVDFWGGVVVASRQSGLYRLDSNCDILDRIQGQYISVARSGAYLYALKEVQNSRIKLETYVASGLDLTKAREITMEITSENTRIHMAAVDADIFISSSSGKCLYKINPQNGRILATLGYPQLDHPLTITPAGPHWILIVDHHGHCLNMMNADNEEWIVLKTVGRALHYPTAALVASNGFLYVTASDYSLANSSSLYRNFLFMYNYT